MKFLSELLNNKFVRLLLILLIATLLIWFIGPFIAIAEYYPFLEIVNRLFAILAIFVLIASIQAYQFYRNYQAKNALVDGMAQVDETKRLIDSEATELKAKFEKAFGQLKAKTGRDSLLELPWYMIIGSPGSGKTTLLSNSGLKFPLAEHFQNRAIQGVGGTKNCDWWITQDAVMLDTAGRYTSRDSQTEVDDAGWSNFIALINKYRKKPINGLLVSFSIADLLSQSESEISSQIQRVQQRITDLNRAFDTTFPVYIFLTKSDLLAGFSQFFEDLTQQEREQVLGVTFSADSSLQGDALGKVFRQKFSELLHSLERRQWPRIDAERDAGRKALLFGFVRQIATLAEQLTNIVVSLSEPTIGQQPGFIRGLYFTSGTQSGSPVDRLIDKISRAFGVKAKSSVLWNDSGRSFFIKDLLLKVVFREADGFDVFNKFYQRKQRLYRLIAGGIGVVGVVIIGLWSVIFIQNISFINKADSFVLEWDPRTLSSYKGADFRTVLPLLNEFRYKLDTLREDSASIILGGGVSQTGDLLAGFTQNYQNSLNTILLPSLVLSVESALKREKNQSDTYDALKAYLMLGHSKYRDAEFLADFFEGQVVFPELTDNERAQFQKHVTALVHGQMAIEDLDKNLIAATRDYLRSFSLSNIHYLNFKKKYLTAFSPGLTLDQLAGADWRALFASDNEANFRVPSLFTPDFYQSRFGELIELYVKNLSNEGWVLESGSVFDSKQMQLELANHYARDYQSSWQALLNSLYIKRITSEIEMQRQLDVAATVNSPIYLLLESVAEATLLKREATIAGNVIKRAGKVDSRLLSATTLLMQDSIANSISGPFERIQLLNQPEGKSNWQKQMSNSIQDLSFNLANPASSNDRQSLNNSIRILRAFAFSQPEPLKGWVNQLAQNADGVLANVTATEMATQAAQHWAQLARTWKDEVLPVCMSAVTGHYPFSKDAVNDVPLTQFIGLFSLNGTVGQFFSTNIRPLLKSTNRPYRWDDEAAAQYKISDNVLRFYERIDSIRQQLFGKATEQPLLILSFKPLLLDSKASKFRMNIHGQEFSYQFGRAISTNVEWPPQNPALPVEYAFVRQDGSELSHNFNGAFSVFRLLEQSTTTTRGQRTFEILLRKEAFTATYEVTIQEPGNSGLLDELSSFKCLADL